MKKIVKFEFLIYAFDVSVVLLTPARYSATRRAACLQQAQSLLLYKQTVDNLCLLIFRYTDTLVLLS